MKPGISHFNLPEFTHNFLSIQIRIHPLTLLYKVQSTVPKRWSVEHLLVTSYTVLAFLLISSYEKQNREGGQKK